MFSCEPDMYLVPRIIKPNLLNFYTGYYIGRVQLPQDMLELKLSSSCALSVFSPIPRRGGVTKLIKHPVSWNNIRLLRHLQRRHDWDPRAWLFYRRSRKRADFYAFCPRIGTRERGLAFFRFFFSVPSKVGRSAVVLSDLPKLASYRDT